MATFTALSRGTRLVLVGGPLLLVSLFLTWQHVEIDYGSAGVASAALDGWDAWGLLLGLLTVSLVAIVVLRSLTEVDLSDEFPWPRLTLALGAAILAVALAKNLLDAGSSWASYAFVGLAGVVFLGTYLDWRSSRVRTTAPAHRRRGISSVV